MNITIYTDADTTGSTHIMAVDLKNCLDSMGNVTTIAVNMKQVAESKPDLLLNFIPKDIITLQKQAGRYFYCGKLITVFTPGLSVFNDPQVAYMLISAVTNPIVAHSPAIYESLVANAKRLFSPSILRKVLTNIHLIKYGVGDYEFTKKSGDALNWWVAPFTRAVADHKRFPLHQELNAKAQTMMTLRGVPMHTAFYASSDKLSHIEGKDMYGYDVRPIVLDRKAYAQELQKFGFSMSTSDYESLGLYYVELLMSGVIVIFSDFPWVHKLLPDYRFVAKDGDLPALAVYVREHYDECFQYLQDEVLPILMRDYRIKSFATKLLETVGEPNA